MSSEDQEKAAAAVLVESEPMPSDSVRVAGIDFDAIQQKARERGSGISIDDLVAAMYTTGFQASSLGKAVDVINHMV